MKAAAVGPILLLRVDDKPFTLPAAGRKGPKQVYRESFRFSRFTIHSEAFLAAIGSFDRSDNDR